VAHVDAAADPVGVFQLLGQLDEPGRLHTGCVLQEDLGRGADAAEAGVQVPEGGDRVVGRLAHARVVVDDHARQATGQAAGELLDRPAVPLAQQVQPAIQVNGREARVRRHEREDPVQLVRRVGVQLGGQAGLREPEAGQPEQRVISGVPRQEQGVNDAMTRARVIHGPPSPVRAFPVTVVQRPASSSTTGANCSANMAFTLT
jgi:hypothetical protein